MRKNIFVSSFSVRFLRFAKKKVTGWLLQDCTRARAGRGNFTVLCLPLSVSLILSLPLTVSMPYAWDIHAVSRNTHARLQTHAHTDSEGKW